MQIEIEGEPTTESHSFVIVGYIVRKGPGAGMHYGACPRCGGYADDPIHNFEEPKFLAAEEKMKAMRLEGTLRSKVETGEFDRW